MTAAGGKEGVAGLQLFLRYLAVILFLSIATMVASNKWCSPETLNYDQFSSDLIVNSVVRYDAGGDRDVGGFMTATERTVHIAAVEYIDGRKGARTVYPYISHFGLQYVVARHLGVADPGKGPMAIPPFSLLCGLGMTLVVAALALFADGQFGRSSGAAVALVFATSPSLLLHAMNPYWVIFLGFLPMLAMLVLYPKAGNGRQFAAVAGAAGFLTFVKCLTGYEYISVVGLGAALPIIYYEAAASDRWDRAMIGRIFIRGLVLGGYVFAGFAMAALLHILKAAHFFGSMEKGIMAFTVPLSYSTWDTSSGIRENADVTVSHVIDAINSTMLLRNMQATVPVYGGLVLTFALLIGRNGWSARQLWCAMDRRHRALLLTWLASIPASLSWFVLAVRHSIIHPHINWIVGYMGLLAFGAMLLGRNLSMLWRVRLSRQHRAPA